MADSTETPDSAAQDDAVPPAPARGGIAFDPRRILWLAVLAAAGAVVVLALWLFRMVSTERALSAVSSSVSLPASPAPAPVVAAAPAVPAPSPAPAPEMPATPPTSAAPATAAAANPEARNVVRNTRSKKAHQATKRRGTAAARGTIARGTFARGTIARGTFARCPALGKPGAVMCRWHICNGGAGKEAVCRPYLERRP